MHPPKRVQILLKIDEIQNEHCKDCEKVKITDGNGRNAICNNQCDVGKKLQHLGQLLLENKAKKVVKKEMAKVKKAKELTKETFLQLSDEGKTNKQIIEMFGLNNVKFYKMKKEWGLVNKMPRNKTKVDRPVIKPTIKEVPEVKVETSTVQTVEEKATKEKSDNPCDCTRQLNEQILALKSELAQQKKTNDDLAQTIQVLNKYKSMYFTTVEALKIHLP